MKVILNALQAGNRSGTGRYAAELAKRLPGMAEDVEVQVLWPSQLPLPDRADAARFIVRNAEGGLPRMVWDQAGLGRLAKAAGASLVHYPANIGSLFSHVPHVVTVHDLSFFHEPAWFPANRALYYRRGVARSAPRAHRIATDSQATADDLTTFLGIAPARIDVIPLGVSETYRPVEPSSCRGARAKYHLPEHFFLFMGTIEPRKNVPRLIEAWERIAGDCEYDLVLAGRLGWKAGPVHAQVRASANRERIHFPGYVDEEDQAAVLSTARAFVWPSLWEGFGLPPLEAMACGTPVLTSSVSSLPEVVSDAAIIVDPHQPSAIANGMLRIARDEKLRETLRATGLERAAQFRWKRTAELTLDLYRNAYDTG